MNKNLIFDIGMHKCEDTSYYLAKGYDVIAVDANPKLIQLAQSTHKEFIDSKQLRLLNYAISNKENEEVSFFVGTRTIWSSLDESLASKKNSLASRITVKSKKLSTLIENFGVPYYCKIDIEGYDGVALDSLMNLNELPPYISVESECFSDGEEEEEEKILTNLRKLSNLGYQHFKLIDQNTLVVLEENVPFFTNNKILLYRIFDKLSIPFGNKKRLKNKLNYQFHKGATGPFGEDTDKKWLKYDEAESTLLQKRKEFFQLKRGRRYGFWCDLHARQ